MTKKQEIQLLEEKKVRSVWDSEQEKWYFSIVDICGILTDQPDQEHARNYWKVLKYRLIKEGNETVTNCNRLKLLSADGKMRLSDVADQEQMFRLIQSIPSPKAEPFKVWMAQVASQRLDQKQGTQYASLTDIITKEWSGMTTRQYKQHKGLKKESLRDNMTNVELTLNMLAEASTAEISKEKSPKGFAQSGRIAKESGSVANAARKQLESKTGKSAISSAKASDYLLPTDDKEA